MHAVRCTSSGLAVRVKALPHAEHAAPGAPLLLQSALKASSELAKSKAALEGDLQDEQDHVAELEAAAADLEQQLASATEAAEKQKVGKSSMFDIFQERPASCWRRCRLEGTLCVELTHSEGAWSVRGAAPAVWAHTCQTRWPVTLCKFGPLAGCLRAAGQGEHEPEGRADSDEAAQRGDGCQGPGKCWWGV